MEGFLGAHGSILRGTGGFGGDFGRDGDADGDTDVGLGGAAVALGGQVKVGGGGRRDGLGAVDVDGANAVDGGGGGVGGAPVEDDGLAEVDGERIGGEGCGGRGRRRGLGGRSAGGSYRGSGFVAPGDGVIANASMTAARTDRVRREWVGKDCGVSSVSPALPRLQSSFMVLKIKVDAGGVPCELPLGRGRGLGYFQLQLGMSAPGPVSGRFWVPSASMDQMRVWSARPSAELA